MYTVLKQYRDFPAAHRQPNHDGHCRLIHGHNWGWDIVFGAEFLDTNGFVIDVGALCGLKSILADKFDHTLLLNKEDPYLEHLEDSLQTGNVTPFAVIIAVPNCGMEGLAKYVYDLTSDFLKDHFNEDVGKRYLRVVEVTCHEDSKNSSTYHPLSNFMASR